MKTIAWTIMLLIAVLTTMMPADAQSSTNIGPCAQLSHTTSGRSNDYRVALSEVVTPSVSCPTGQDRFTLPRGDCITLQRQYAHNIAGPSEPSRVIVIIAVDTAVPKAHGLTGNDDWFGDDSSKTPYWVGESVTTWGSGTDIFCGTVDGNPSSAGYDWPQLRLIIRACLEPTLPASTGFLCQNTPQTYDINSDDGGSAGTGASSIGQSGIIEKGDGEDPITVWVDDIRVNTKQNVTVRLEFDNRTARTGAAQNVSIWVVQPNGYFHISGHKLNETFINDTALGFYHFNFWPNMTGTWHVYLNHTTSLNEKRASNPIGFRVYANTTEDIYYLMQTQGVPTTVALPATIVVVSLIGVAVGFMSKNNPVPSLVGAIVQLLVLGFWWTQPDSVWQFGNTSMKVAVFLLGFLAFVGLGWRTYLIGAPARNAYGDVEG